MTCPHCGAEIVRKARFCGDCGKPLLWLCTACGTENLASKRYCSQCGASYEAATGAIGDAPAAVAERRQLTVMFVDLVDSTELVVRLDPEDMHRAISDYHRCGVQVVTRFGGLVARYLGDGMLVYFGYPKAQEDDAERAVRAGLALADEIGRLPTVAGPPGTLSVRVGIATGLVVVGELIASAMPVDVDVVGSTLNLASRLQSIASPGEVAIADSTRQLLGGLFTYRDLGRLSLKGFAGGVHCWVVLSESVVESRFEALRSSQVPLVGREEELTLLLRRWQHACDEEGQIAVLLGEPGIGKSRLIAAFEQRLDATRYTRIRLGCSPHSQDTPLDPFLRYFERAAGFDAADAAATKRAKLDRLLSTTGCAEADIALIADLLSIAGAGDPAPDGLAPHRRRERVFGAILGYLASVAQQSPTLLIVEDMHWADPTTCDLLELQVDAIPAMRMLIVVSTRPEYQPSWVAHPQVTVRLLGRLHYRDARSLIGAISANDRAPPLPDDIVEQIIRRADGVPLFIEELTKTVVETGRQFPAVGPSAAAEPLSVDLVPSSLQDSLMARLDRLDAGKEIAQIGAVIGRVFSFDAIQQLSAMAPQQLIEGLSRLVDAGLATARGAMPDVTYSFKHALVQDAAYASLPHNRRRALHERLADLLRTSADNGANIDPGLIAWHFGEARAAGGAIQYYLKAAERATGRFASVERVNHLRKGLQQLGAMPESVERLRHELDLRVFLGQALLDHEGSGSEGVRECFERAHELCLALGDRGHLLMVLDGLVLNYHFAHSESEKMASYADELLANARQTDDDLMLLWSLRMRASANLLRGHFVEARADMETVVAMYDERPDDSQDQLMARDPRASTYFNLGICLTALGYPDSGTAMTLRAIRHAEARDHRVTLMSALRRACVQGMMLRDTAAVREFSNRLIALNAEQETFVYVREGEVCHGWARLRTGRDPVLIDRVLVCLDELDAAKHWVMLPFFMMSVAELLGELGDAAGAVGLLARAGELIALSGERWCEAEIARIKARFAVPDREEAADLLRSSLAIARQQNARLWELRAAAAIAELRRQDAEGPAARDLLAGIYGWFTEGLDTPDLSSAKALLQG
jgi:class 3 adenylate cyclase/tetratricopeptide (TPR) repeat protein